MPPHGAEASSRRSFGSPARKVCPASGSQIRLECQFRSPGARQNRPSFHEKHATSLSQRDAASNTIKQLRFVPGLKRCNRVADCHGGKTFWSWFCARTGRGSQVRSPSRPPPTLCNCIVSETLAIAPQSQRHVCQILWLARSLLLQSSRMSPFRRPVSAAKNSVPDSSFGDWFR